MSLQTRKKWLGNVRGNLCFSDREMVEFRILEGGNKINQALAFQRRNFVLQDLLEEIPLDTVLAGRGVLESWLFSRITF